MLWPNGLKEQITAVFLEAFPYLKIVVHEIVGSPGDAGVGPASQAPTLARWLGFCW